MMSSHGPKAAIQPKVLTTSGDGLSWRELKTSSTDGYVKNNKRGLVRSSAKDYHYSLILPRETNLNTEEELKKGRTIPGGMRVHFQENYKDAFLAPLKFNNVNYSADEKEYQLDIDKRIVKLRDTVWKAITHNHYLDEGHADLPIEVMDPVIRDALLIELSRQAKTLYNYARDDPLFSIPYSSNNADRMKRFIENTIKQFNAKFPSSKIREDADTEVHVEEIIERMQEVALDPGWGDQYEYYRYENMTERKLPSDLMATRMKQIIQDMVYKAEEDSIGKIYHKITFGSMPLKDQLIVLDISMSKWNDYYHLSHDSKMSWHVSVEQLARNPDTQKKFLENIINYYDVKNNLRMEGYKWDVYEPPAVLLRDFYNLVERKEDELRAIRNTARLEIAHWNVAKRAWPSKKVDKVSPTREEEEEMEKRAMPENCRELNRATIETLGDGYEDEEIDEETQKTRITMLPSEWSKNEVYAPILNVQLKALLSKFANEVRETRKAESIGESSAKRKKTDSGEENEVSSTESGSTENSSSRRFGGFGDIIKDYVTPEDYEVLTHPSTDWGKFLVPSTQDPTR